MPTWAVRIVAPALQWQGSYLAFNGEIFPGKRTPTVLQMQIHASQPAPAQ